MLNAQLIGCGLYTAPDVARMLHVRTSNLRRWADGYTYKLPSLESLAHKKPPRAQPTLDMLDVPVRSLVKGRREEKERFSPALMRRDLPPIEGRRVFTFAEMIELRFVSWLREHKVKMRLIREVAEVAVELFQADHPFALQDFATDGLRVFALLKQRQSGLSVSDAVLAQELPTCQYVFTSMVEPYFKDLDFGDRWANRWWPLGRDKRVVLDPTRCFGQPIDAETGVPTQSLYQTHLAEHSLKRVAWWYDVPVPAVKWAVEYEKSLAA